MSSSFDPRRIDYTKISLMTECPIWGTRAHTEIDSNNFLQKVVISPRAGGCFIFTDLAEIEIETWSHREKSRLTSWILERNLLGEVPRVDKPALKKLDGRHPATFAERVDNALLFLSDASEFLGTTILFSQTDMYPSMDAGKEHIAWLQFCASIEASSSGEGNFVLNHLSSSEHLRQVDGNNDRIQITAKGYSRLDELTRKNSTDPAKAFVAMWFDPSMDLAWKEGFKPGIEDAGFNPIRIDQKDHINKIDDEIIVEIRESRFVVADFTAEILKFKNKKDECIARGGVYFEAGYAYGLDIPVVWCCRNDVIELVHFDTRQFSHIVWETPEDLRKKLANRIRAVIGPGPNKTEE